MVVRFDIARDNCLVARTDEIQRRDCGKEGAEAAQESEQRKRRPKDISGKKVVHVHRVGVGGIGLSLSFSPVFSLFSVRFDTPAVPYVDCDG